MADAPREAGAVHDSLAFATPASAMTPVGAPGTPGVTALDLVDSGPVPAASMAATVNMYVVPLAKPVTVSGSAELGRRTPEAAVAARSPGAGAPGSAVELGDVFAGHL